MEKYIISKVFVTEKKHSIDGKKHRHTLYYGGNSNLNSCLGNVTLWGLKKDAHIFYSYLNAKRYADYENAKVIKFRR